MATKNVENYVLSTGVHTNNVDMIPFYVCCILGERSSISFNHTLINASGMDCIIDHCMCAWVVSEF